jgi:glycosyltransferase involved in cell wall biosynthesis
VGNKLYIINNGLKDLRGHYFETSVSIAEASWGCGLRPVLAAHLTCPSDIVPDGLEFHPVFTTDHWVGHQPPAQPDLVDLRGELAPLLASPIEALRAGTIDFDRYLRARFRLDEEATQDAAASEPLPGATSVPSPPPLPRRERFKRRVRAVLPPAARRLIPLSKMILREALPPVVWERLRRRWKPEPVDVRPATIEPEPEPEDEPQAAPPDPLAIALERIGAAYETGYVARFQQDLERLLCLTGCGAGDHVFLPTAHGRELCAILHLMADWPVESQPTFHLEFRHGLDMAGPQAPVGREHPYCTVHRAFFEHARRFPLSDRLRLYTDTEELSEDFERFSGLEFGVLPIPFRTRLLGNPSRQGRPLCVAFFGDVREEKGFHWLPGLVDALMEEHVATGRVRFLIQASLVRPEDEPLCRAALAELRKYAEDRVELVGLNGPLAPDRYYQLVSQADLLLCPYHPETYRCRSSGTLTEAIAAGIPTVVPRGTWLARQQPPGSGETFDDRESFLAAVRRICDHHAPYHAQALAGRGAWLERHSPERLVRALLGQRTQASPCIGKVA